jgi:hypothetical protein
VKNHPEPHPSLIADVKYPVYYRNYPIRAKDGTSLIPLCPIHTTAQILSHVDFILMPTDFNRKLAVRCSNDAVLLINVRNMVMKRPLLSINTLILIEDSDINISHSWFCSKSIGILQIGSGFETYLVRNQLNTFTANPTQIFLKFATPNYAIRIKISLSEGFSNAVP